MESLFAFGDNVVGCRSALHTQETPKTHKAFRNAASHQPWREKEDEEEEKRVTNGGKDESLSTTISFRIFTPL